MAGQLYHHICPDHQDSAVHWLLYDGFANECIVFADAAWASKIPLPWIEAVRQALSEHNPFACALFYLAGIDPTACPTAHICLDPTGPGNEIAAIMNFNNTTVGDVNTRKSIVIQHSRNYQSILTISHLWEPLVYPLFFPHGTLGWGVVSSHSDLDEELDNLGNKYYIRNYNQCRQLWKINYVLLSMYPL